MSLILGISAFYHDSAACLLRDASVISAAQEERFTRKKFDNRFPERSIAYCLKEAGCSVDELDYAVFYEKPLRKLDRILKTHMAATPFSADAFARFVETWIPDRMDVRRLVETELGQEFSGEVLFTGHHEAHAASSFYISSFERAALLTVDGVGEWTTTSLGAGRGNEIELLKEIRFPHSLGLLYSTFTYYTGFKVNSGEYKMMGLAPYGTPAYAKLILQELVDLKQDGSFRLNLDYFDFWRGNVMTNAQFHRCFGGPPRSPGAPIEQRHMDIAASIQAVTEEIMLALAREAKRVTGENKLCLAGGVALNCVANGRLLREGPFDDIFIPPVPGDAGAALGAALIAWHRYLGGAQQTGADIPSRPRFSPFLGPAFSDDEIGACLHAVGANFRRIADEGALLDQTVEYLDEGKVVGWFQGRMEYGPRALGARSILADPRHPQMQRTLNLKIKFRESFRPFAPAVLAERTRDYFEFDRSSAYMQFVAPMAGARRKDRPLDEDAPVGLARLHVTRSDIPAVTHVDCSARLQTVSENDNSRFYGLLKAFERRTGCGVLVNTSFNINDEPIVCTPEEAYRCFMATEMDVLVMGNWVLRKDEQQVMQEHEEDRWAATNL
jgi:carbamoyltransferase